MRISDWSSDVCSSDLEEFRSNRLPIALAATAGIAWLLREPIKEHVPRPGRRLRDLADGAIDLLRPGAADTHDDTADTADRSEEHTSELQSLMRISYAVFCLKKKKNNQTKTIDISVPIQT